MNIKLTEKMLDLLNAKFPFLKWDSRYNLKLGDEVKIEQTMIKGRDCRAYVFKGKH